MFKTCARLSTAMKSDETKRFTLEVSDVSGGVFSLHCETTLSYLTTPHLLQDLLTPYGLMVAQGSTVPRTSTLRIFCDRGYLYHTEPLINF